MYRDVTQWTRIRRRVLTGRVSGRQIARETGISRKTVQKMIEFPLPPGYRREKPADRSKLGPFLGVIDQTVKEDCGKPKKERHTAKQIYNQLKEANSFAGSYTIVKDYVRETHHRMDNNSANAASPFGASQPSFESEDPAQVAYELIQSVPKRDAIGLLRATLVGGPPQFDRERFYRQFAVSAVKETRDAAKRRLSQTAFEWMHRVLQGEVSIDAVTKEVGDLPGLNELLTAVAAGQLASRKRALAVLAREKGISLSIACAFLNLPKQSVLKYCRRYHEGGVGLLMARKVPCSTKFDKESNKQAVFSLIHTPPSAYGLNRTTWRMADLEAVLQRQGTPLCRGVIRRILKEAGFKWRKARIVLTSTDPEYRTNSKASSEFWRNLDQMKAFSQSTSTAPSQLRRRVG
jgi:transposase